MNNFLGYLKERFPLTINIPIIFIFNITLYMGAGITEKEIIFSNSVIPGFIAIFLIFFHLRLFDDLKDYSKDSKARLMTQKQIKHLAFFTILLEIILVIMVGVIPLIFYSIVLLYSILMLNEFFIGEKLTKKILLYNLSHQFIIVLIGFYIYSFYYKTYNINEPVFFIYLLLMLSSLSIFEIIRKIKNKDEKDYKKSYEHLFGKTKFVIYTAILALLVGISSFVILFYTLKNQISATLQITITLLTLIILFKYSKQFSKITNKSIKKITIAYLLSSILLLDLTILFSKDILVNLLLWSIVL